MYNNFYLASFFRVLTSMIKYNNVQDPFESKIICKKLLSKTVGTVHPYKKYLRESFYFQMESRNLSQPT